MLVFLVSAASAEIYSWEDADGVHFTDSPPSVPEKYREKPVSESNVQAEFKDPHVKGGMSQQNTLVANQEKRAADHQASLEQHKQSAEAAKKKQISARKFENTLQSLVKFIVIWIILGFSLFVVWMVTIVDIVRSDFITPSSKTVWMLLVLFLPLLGMLFYMFMGSNQKSN